MYYHRNQQYSIVALTGNTGAIQERYAYSAYGTPTITDSAGALRAASAVDNRITYTGREWDAGLVLYHYRARLYDPTLGRFCSRDPIGYRAGDPSIYRMVFNRPLGAVDPMGLLLLVTGDTRAETDDVLALLNELCPAGDFVIDNLGQVSSKVPKFCDWQTKYKAKSKRCHSYTTLIHYSLASQSSTPNSCTCICDAMQMSKTIRIIPYKQRFLAQPPGRLIKGAKTVFPDNGEIWPQVGPPEPAKNKDGTLVRMPAFIQLGHELCGHAVAGHGQSQGAIDVENEIRLEHGIDDLRDGSDHNLPSWFWPF